MISKINIYFLWDKIRSKIYGPPTFWKIVWKNQFLIIVIKNRDPYPSKTKLCLIAQIWKYLYIFPSFLISSAACGWSSLFKWYPTYQVLPMELIPHRRQNSSNASTIADAEVAVISFSFIPFNSLVNTCYQRSVIHVWIQP